MWHLVQFSYCTYLLDFSSLIHNDSERGAPFQTLCQISRAGFGGIMISSNASQKFFISRHPHGRFGHRLHLHTTQLIYQVCLNIADPSPGISSRKAYATLNFLTIDNSIIRSQSNLLSLQTLLDRVACLEDTVKLLQGPSFGCIDCISPRVLIVFHKITHFRVSRSRRL